MAKTWTTVQSTYEKKDLSKIPPCEVPGIYKLEITSASRRTGTIKKETSKRYGEEWAIISLSCVAFNANNELVGRVNLSLFESDYHVNNLCYFTNSRDTFGQLYLPDAVSTSYNDKLTGEQKSFEHYPCFEGKEIYAAVEPDEPYINNAGVARKQWRLISFCDAQGFTAKELQNGVKVHGDDMKIFLDYIATIAPAPVISESALTSVPAGNQTTMQQPYGAQPQAQQGGYIAQAVQQNSLQQRASMQQFERPGMTNTQVTDDPLPF